MGMWDYPGRRLRFREILSEQEERRKQFEREANVVLTVLGLALLYLVSWWLGVGR